MIIANILRQKGSRVIAVAPEDDMIAVVGILAVHHIGAVLVRDADGEVRGILSERDVVRAVARKGGDALELRAEGLMTRVLYTVSPEDTASHALAMMTENRIRHLPVLDERGKLMGMVSIGDLVKARLAETELEAETLRDYVATAG